MILQAVTTTRLIKYDTVKHKMLNISEHNEMRIAFVVVVVVVK